MSSKIPRLEFEDLEGDLKEALRPRVERLNYLGEFFKVTGHIPTVLLPFIDFTENLKGVLAKNLTEVGALTVAGVMCNDYERNQHERLSEKLGFSRVWIAEVNRIDPDASGEMSEKEKDVQRIALALLERDWEASRRIFDRLIDSIGHEQALAVLMLVGRYTVHAMTVNTLALDPPVPSIFDGDKG
ncbi:MAG: hypothetical protein WD489_01470 [Rhodovibrionaceae bacterium]